MIPTPIVLYEISDKMCFILYSRRIDMSMFFAASVESVKQYRKAFNDTVNAWPPSSSTLQMCGQYSGSLLSDYSNELQQALTTDMKPHLLNFQSAAESSMKLAIEANTDEVKQNLKSLSAIYKEAILQKPETVLYLCLNFL